MKKQVLSIEQMKRLHELGLDTSQASMEYIEDNNGKILCISKENKHNIKDIEEGFIICEAFTLQDIVDLLPGTIINNGDEYCLEFGLSEPDKSGWYIQYKSVQTISVLKYVTFIDAAYEMLCWCIENGYITTNEFKHENNNNL